jgi:prepilin-type processing-associated H-X9-DG protein
MGAPCILILAGLVGLIVWFVALVRGSFPARDSQSRARHTWKVLRKWGLFVLGVLLFVALLLPMFSMPREAVRRAHCMNNLRQIGLAMSAYHDAHQCFPPAYTSDTKGRPLHSWRTLVLPYLEYGGLYDQLRLAEPWNSPHNKAVFASAETPAPYRCPSGRDDPQYTSYAMVVGPGTVSDGPNSRRREDVRDGLNKTVIVVEAAGHGIPWYEPRDLDFAHMSFTIKDPNGNAIRSEHSGLANALFADGSTRLLNQDLRPEFIKSLLTIAGGEDFDESDFY